jgi:hypothetical protein
MKIELLKPIGNLRKLIPLMTKVFLMVNNLNVHHYLEKKQLCLLKKSRQYIENM